MTVLFTDVLPGAGGTFIAADSAKHVARWFSEHPEGSHGLPGDATKRIIAACDDFVELTGRKGADTLDSDDRHYTVDFTDS